MLSSKVAAEHQRLADSEARRADWKNWGLYLNLSERAWGTVREDYSATGEAWDYFPHDHARSRAYRWNEDGLAGVSNRFQHLCLAVGLWNERDPILKERLFGLTGTQGNHGEDVKEYYYYLDRSPTHSYMRMLYKYPQIEFPYVHLPEENRKRGHDAPEFELVDTLRNVLGEGRYAGTGGNGRGGLCSARHLHNDGFRVYVILDREAKALRGAAAEQLRILQAAGLRPVNPSRGEEVIGRADLVVDALVGYGLQAALRGRTAKLIDQWNASRADREHATGVLSLDVPLGLVATTGKAPGLVLQPERTLALALPKTGLLTVTGDLYLADIGIPWEVYPLAGIQAAPLFQDRFWIRLDGSPPRDRKDSGGRRP